MTDREPAFIKQTSWKYRRIFLYVINAVILIYIGFVLGLKIDTVPADTFMSWGLSIIGVSVLVYVFGAVIDDRFNIGKMLGQVPTVVENSKRKPKPKEESRIEEDLP